MVKIIKKNIKLKLKFNIDALPSFSFDSNLNLYFKTFITQEMLKKKFWQQILYIAVFNMKNI